MLQKRLFLRRCHQRRDQCFSSASAFCLTPRNWSRAVLLEINTLASQKVNRVRSENKMQRNIDDSEANRFRQRPSVESFVFLYYCTWSGEWSKVWGVVEQCPILVAALQNGFVSPPFHHHQVNVRARRCPTGRQTLFFHGCMYSVRAAGLLLKHDTTLVQTYNFLYK